MTFHLYYGGSSISVSILSGITLNLTKEKLFDMKKILISTGGSGGHVYQQFHDHLSKTDVLLCTDRRSFRFFDKI